MAISSRTPEGRPHHCPVCGSEVTLEPSDPSKDAPCPCCGHLLWFIEAPPTARSKAWGVGPQARSPGVNRSGRDQRDPSGQAVSALEDEWRRGGEPSLVRLWAAYDPRGSLTVLSALIMADLRCRYARGQRPAIADYLVRFPALRTAGEQVVGLLYEEYCLREESGERPAPEPFCARYPDWHDSLASQLHYHGVLRRRVSPMSPRLPGPGEWFGTLRLHSVLGRVGDARLYLAHDEEIGGRPVMVSVSPERGDEPSILGRLEHAHILPILRVVFDHATGRRGLVMPYRPGLPLDELIARIHRGSRPLRARALWHSVATAGEGADGSPGGPGGPAWEGFPRRGTFAQAAAWVVLMLARALEHAHARGILHLGIMPADILMTPRDGPQLMGFNAACVPRPAEPAEAAMRGRALPYMAPEQLAVFLDPTRWSEVGPAADLFGLGLVLRELLTGGRPEAPDPALPPARAIGELLDRRAILLAAPRSPEAAIPRGLDAIVVRCLMDRPSDRYSSAWTLAEDLRRWLAISAGRRLLTAAGMALGLIDDRAGAPAKRPKRGELAPASGVWDRELDG